MNHGLSLTLNKTECAAEKIYMVKTTLQDQNCTSQLSEKTIHDFSKPELNRIKGNFTHHSTKEMAFFCFSEY